MSAPIVLSNRVPLKQAAGILGVSTATLRVWTRKRRLSSYRISKKLMFSTEELDRVIRESEQPRLQNAA